MNRRNLLSLLPTAGVGLATPSEAMPIVTSALNSRGFAISVQCWSFRRFTLFEAIEMSAAAGATAIEFFPGQPVGGPIGDVKLNPNMRDDQVFAILEQCKQHQITPANFGVTDIPNDETRARVVFEFAKKLGLYGITTESIEALDTIEPLAKEFDIKVCFHNHPKPTKLWNPDKIWRAIRDRDERVGYCADIGHWATSGLEPLDVIKRIAPRVHSFHMKERVEIGKWTHDRPFGTGIIDNMAILDEVLKHSFAGSVSIEYEHNWETSLAEIAQCVGFLRAYGQMRR